MPICDPTFSQVHEWNAAVVIVCDECPRIIDVLDKKWYDVVLNHVYIAKDGTETPMDLYDGPLLCWECRGKMNENANT